MRKSFLFAGIAVATMIPSLASAQQSCERQRSNRVVATVGGAAVGGVAGNVIAGRGDKTLGTVIGAVVGAVVGNQVTKADAGCSRAFGYYARITGGIQLALIGRKPPAIMTGMANG